MTTWRKQSRLSIRDLSALCVAALLFFLCYTAPHRVHHFFDRAQPQSTAHTDDHHGNSDTSNQPPNDTDCVFQTSANRCAAGLSGGGQLANIFWQRLPLVVRFDHQLPHQFISTPFHSRAPPVA
jgi:hypothetical protein